MPGHKDDVLEGGRTNSLQVGLELPGNGVKSWIKTLECNISCFPNYFLNNILPESAL